MSTSVISPLVSQLPSEVLDTVTAANQQQAAGLVPIQAVWKEPISEVSVLAAANAAVIAAAASTAAASSGSASGIPKQVYNVDASEHPFVASDGSVSGQVTVDWDVLTSDPFYAGAQIWLTYYNGSATPQLVAQSSTAPISFLTKVTNENVTITVVAVGSNGRTSGFAGAPSTTLVLNGQLTAPVYPSIAQGLTAISGGSGTIGWQFSFNILSGQAGAIAGYQVYHNSTNTLPTDQTALNNCRWHYINQPASNQGVYTVQEITGGTTQEYYWISAVNTVGMESPKNYVPIAATGGSGHTPVAGSLYPVASSTPSGNFAFANPTYAYDGNEGDAATYGGYTPGTYGGIVLTFPAWTGYTPIQSSPPPTLSIMTSASASGSASVQLDYSLNGGTSWSNIYTLSGLWAFDLFDALIPARNSRAQQYDSVALPPTQDFSQLQVRVLVAVGANNRNAANASVYNTVLTLTA